MITIKPHHFIDIIKLYGAGYDTFTPDEHYQHSFYSVGNSILENPYSNLLFTVDCDDICENCIYREGLVCKDVVSGLGTFTSKDVYNKEIDYAIIDKIGLTLYKKYTALEYCKLLLQNKDIIFSVWTLEPHDILAKRNNLFWNGVERYLRTHSKTEIFS